MTREDAIEEIERIIGKAKLQACGMMDSHREEDPRELAEYIVALVEQIS